MSKSTKFKILASQSSTGDPEIVIQRSDLWFTPEFVRLNTGDYALYIPGIDENNVNVTYSAVGSYNAGEPSVLSHVVNGGPNSHIQFFTFSLGDPADGLLFKTPINVEIFHS